MLSAAWSLTGPLGLDNNIPATSCNCRYCIREELQALSRPLYIVLRKQSDHGTLTMYFADHKLLTFKYLNQGPILHLRQESASCSVWNAKGGQVWVIPTDMTNVRPAMWKPPAFRTNGVNMIQTLASFSSFSQSAEKTLSVSPSRANVEPYRRKDSYIQHV